MGGGQAQLNAAAQMLDVARVAGVSVGTLYNYVEGKGALLLLCACPQASSVLTLPNFAWSRL